MELFVVSSISCVISTAVTWIVFLLRSETGVLRIDRSEPEKDKYKIEIDNLDNLAKKKYLLLTVDNNANLSQD